MFPILRPILNKGGAGYYISREETVERLNPLVGKAHELLATYNAFLDSAGEQVKNQLEEHMPKMRMLLGKMCESVFSAGGIAPNGVGIAVPNETSLSDVLDLEREFRENAFEEIDTVHHQERTRAILKAVVEGSDGRLETVRYLMNRLPQHARD